MASDQTASLQSSGTKRSGQASPGGVGKRYSGRRPPPTADTGSGRLGTHRLLPYVFILPLVLLVGALSLFPAIITTVQAFFRVDPLDPPDRFTGLANFRTLFADPAIRASLVNTAAYTVLAVVGSVVLGTAIAVALQRPTRYRGILLAAAIIPWAIPPVVVAVIWSWIYDPNFGVLNSFLKSLHLISQYHVWIGLSRPLTIALIELVQIWEMTPLAFLIILAALQAVPRDVYEAAQIDGASTVRQFTAVTLPLIRPAVAIAATQAVILAVNIFDQVYVLNGNALAGNSLMIQTYFVTFTNLNFGEGYALSLVATSATALLSLAIVAALYRRTEY